MVCAPFLLVLLRQFSDNRSEPLHKLINLSRLRTLELRVPTPKLKSETPFLTSEATLSWLLASLESLEGTSLEFVTIHKVPITDISIRLASRIDLCLSKLPRLQLAYVKLCYTPDPWACAGDYFPLLHRRGALKQCL